MRQIKWSSRSSCPAGINSETDSLFDFLCSEIEGAENITYSHRRHIQDAYAVRDVPGHPVGDPFLHHH